MNHATTNQTTTRSCYNAFSNGYDRFLYPLERAVFARVRRTLIPQAQGRILELAVGTGINLPLYPHGSCVVALDMSEKVLFHARRRAGESCAGLLQADAARLPFGAAQFDTVISTLLYCSLDAPAVTLAEIRRVLSPDGRLLMMEHVRGSPPIMRALTDLVNIPWHAFTHTCRLNREPASELPAAGFEILCQSRYMFSIIQTIVARPGS